MLATTYFRKLLSVDPSNVAQANFPRGMRGPIKCRLQTQASLSGIFQRNWTRVCSLLTIPIRVLITLIGRDSQPASFYLDVSI